MAMMRNSSSFLMVLIFIVLLAGSCTNSVNKDDLSGYLLNSADLDQALYKVDSSENFSKEFSDAPYDRRVSSWIVAEFLPAESVFLISHALYPLKINGAYIPAQFPVFIFPAGRIYQLKDDVTYYDLASCSVDDAFAECVFVSRYDNIVSVLSVSSKIKDDDYKAIVSQAYLLLDVIGGKLK